MSEIEIEIDGSEGEGGGQILRTALALSVITGRRFRIFKIRARRSKPGLLRQHLTAVEAAAAVGAAKTTGASLRSTELRFEPSGIVGGEHRFAVGTAGSATLVCQTVLWPLLVHDGASTVTFEGGTHNPMAPPFEFLDEVLFARLREIGARVNATLDRCGFYPAGGGRFTVRIEGPTTWSQPAWTERGAFDDRRARAVVSALPDHVARRELQIVAERIGWRGPELQACPVDSPGPGNALCLHLGWPGGRTVVTAFGDRGVRAEKVARRATDELERFAAAEVPVDEHLADQLLIPLALAGGGRFRTLTPSLHTTTNAEIIARFLPVDVTIDDVTRRTAEVTVRPREG